MLEREIRGRLDEVEAALEKAVRADSDMLAETAQYLLAAGGKRFRPMLVLLSGYFGDPSDPRLVPGSVSIELVHQATLYHDDVIDEADARHAVQSANARWSNTVAILTGDYLFAKASEISTDLGTDICALLARTIATLCDGQIREVEAAGRVEQSEADYLDIIRRKTGALIATSCRLGGMLSDAPAEALDVLEQYGEALGLAFQLSDDIMDLTASQETLGKEPGQDLREGVYTLPVLHALGDPGVPNCVRSWRTDPRAGASGPGARDRPGPGHLARRARPPWSSRSIGPTACLNVSRTARPGPRSGSWPSSCAARCGAGELRGRRGTLARIRAARENIHKRGDLLPVVRGRPRGPDRRRGARRGGVRRRKAHRTPAAGRRQAAHVRMRDRPGRRGLVAEPGPLLRLRVPVRDLRRRVRLPVPVGRIFESLGYQAVVEMAIFIGILAVGLLYAWRKGVLRWA